MKLQTERQMQKNLLLQEGDYENTRDVFERIARYLPNKNILAELDEHRNIVYHNAKEILNDIEALGNGLLKLGLENKHIVVSAPNSYRYIIADSAISSGVGVVTPIDKDAPLELFTYLLKKCDADAIICSTEILTKTLEAQKLCKNLKTIITIDKKVDGFLFFDDVCALGRNIEVNEFELKEINLNAPAKILFTSGTTGPNKAVVLTQNNLVANIINCMNSIKARPKEENTSMSVLPMHHATEINTHIMSRIACGRLTYINDDIKNIMTNIKIFKPTNITVVPMIANMFYRGIWSNAKRLGKEDKLKKGIKLCNMFGKFNIDITHKLFKDLFKPFGGNLNQIVCGGAMLNPEVVQGFKDLGVYIINGYGITECGPLVSMNTDTLKDYSSIGIPCSNLQIKLADLNENFVGELCVKGNSVANGYYNDTLSTKQVFDNDGYFHTGDLVRMDKDGKLFLAGRKKNVIILENGKNICPEEIENIIEIHLPYCQDVVVYTAPHTTNGIKKEIICVGIYIEDEETKNNKTKILKDINQVNEALPIYKQIRFVNIAESPYEKTSTRKIKRDTVISKHNEINGIYCG